jgi:REP element-mobilizing transposase RayT
MKRKQLGLFAGEENRSEHGGGIRRGKRKIARPIATRKPMHVILRSSRAVGEWSFLRKENRTAIETLLEKISRRYGIRVIKFQNVGNHLHLLVQGKSRVLLQSFLRTLPAKIALAITQAKKGAPQGRFFDEIIFSRVVEWGRDILRLKNYFFKNQLEAAGLPEELVTRWRSFESTVRLNLSSAT